MNAVGALLAFGAGCMLLGSTATLALLWALMVRVSDPGEGAGCFGLVICGLTLTGAVYFLILAAQHGLPGVIG